MYECYMHVRVLILIERILSSVMDQRSIKQGNKEIAKSCETRDVANAYRCGHLIPVHADTLVDI